MLNSLKFKIGLFIFTASALIQPINSATVTVMPKEDTSLIQIAGTGWQTVSAYGEKKAWSLWAPCGDTVGGKFEFCGTAVETKALIGSGLPSGSAYYRWMWNELEPQDGKIDFARIDQVLKNANSSGQTLEIRVMLELQENAVPQWAIDAGVPMRKRSDNCLYGLLSPDYNHPITKQLVFRLMRALGKRYDDHPGIGSVDIGLLGLWGEGHIYCNTNLNPSLATKKEYIDVVFESFPKTPLLIGVDFGPKNSNDKSEDLVGYCKDKGRCGWRADSWGHWGGDDIGAKMQEYNWQLTKYPNFWKQGPIALEKGKLMFEDSDNRNFTSIIDTTFATSIAWGTSLASNWGRIPWLSNTTEDKIKLNKLKKFVKKIGFRLVLQKATYEENAIGGSTLPITMDWFNRGIAPPYRDLRVAYRLKNNQGQVSAPFITELSVNMWLPGPKTAQSNYKIPTNVANGLYTLEVALVHHNSADYITAIAIEGKTTDGWYPLGNLTVTGNSNSLRGRSENLYSKKVTVTRSGQSIKITPTGSGAENERLKIYSLQGHGVPKVNGAFEIHHTGTYIALIDGREVERFVIIR
jgi:Domain of unknown function (DUF4832)/Beta-galactosidase